MAGGCSSSHGSNQVNGADKMVQLGRVETFTPCPSSGCNVSASCRLDNERIIALWCDSADNKSQPPSRSRLWRIIEAVFQEGFNVARFENVLHQFQHVRRLMYEARHPAMFNVTFVT